MKKPKIHHFVHKDPERAQIQTESKKTDKLDLKPSKKQIPVSYENQLEKKDLKKTIIVITSFIIVLIALYFIQTKTNLLNSLLQKFGI